MVGQAWVDGFSSVVDWRFPDSPPLPLWIITFWIKTGTAIEAQRKWKTSELWFRSLPKKFPGRESLVERVEVTFSLFHSIPWGITMTSTQTPMNALDLTTILLSSSIPGHIINALMNTIASRVDTDLDGLQNAGAERVWVGDLCISLGLHKPNTLWVSYADDKTRAKSLHRVHSIGKEVETGRVSQLFILFCINDNHWVVFKVDFITKTYHYSDSLNGQIPAADICAIKQWLGFHGFPDLCEGVPLPHGTQRDGYSCGIAMANTVEHSLFGDTCWSLEDRETMCISWAIRLMDYQMDYVHVIIIS